MMMDDVTFYGSTTVGEKGQVVLSAKLRRELGIDAGEKMVVLVLKKMPMPGSVPGIVMVKAKDLASVFQRIFGENMGQPNETRENIKKQTNRKKQGAPADK